MLQIFLRWWIFSRKFDIISFHCKNIKALHSRMKFWRIFYLTRIRQSIFTNYKTNLRIGGWVENCRNFSQIACCDQEYIWDHCSEQAVPVNPSPKIVPFLPFFEICPSDSVLRTQLLNTHFFKIRPTSGFMAYFWFTLVLFFKNHRFDKVSRYLAQNDQ